MLLHVTPEYIVVVSNPAEIIVDEDASEIILPGWRGYYVCAPPPPKLAAGLLQHCAQGLCWTTPARAARWPVVS